jgi:hypothetical protein
VSGLDAARASSDVHHESNGEHKTTKDLHEPRIGCCQVRGTALKDFREKSTIGEHDTGEELRNSNITVRSSRDDNAQ